MDELSDIGTLEEVEGGEIKAPETILKKVQAARSIYEALRYRHSKRMLLYSEILGLIGGNPPYDPAELRAAGLQHIANFNSMSPRSVIKRACLAYWNLLFNVWHIASFEIKSKDPEAPFKALKMAEHFDTVLLKYWPSFYIQAAILTTQLVRLGVSPILFHDERSLKWTSIELNRFFVPDATSADMDDVTCVCIESEYTIQHLFDVYKNENGKENSFWDTELLKKFLVEKSRTEHKAQLSDEDITARMNALMRGEVANDKMFSDSIRMVSVFQKEYDGKITHAMFSRDSMTYLPDTGVHDGFLFRSIGQYPSMRNAIIVFTINPGERYIHDNKGVGHEIFSLAQAQIMTECRICDMSAWAASLLVKSPSLSSKDVEQIRWVPGSAINIGSCEVVETGLGTSLDKMIGVAQHLETKIQNNVAYSGTDPTQPDPDRGSMSPVQTTLQATQEFGIQKNATQHFYFTFDPVIQQMVRILQTAEESWPEGDMAKEWKGLCRADGVPDEVLNDPNLLVVKATRSVGAGSQVAHLIGLQGMHPFVGSFGPREQKEFLRHVISATVGPEYIQSFMQDSDDVDEAAGGATVAQLENDMMSIGKPVLFSMDNEQRSHMVTHMTLGQSVIQQLTQQQTDPIAADKIFTQLIPHGDQHLEALSKNQFAADLFQKVMPLWKQIKNYALLNRKNAEKMLQKQAEEQQAAAAEQQRVMSEEELKNMQVQNDEKRKDVKLTEQLNRQKEQQVVKEDIAKRKVEGELAVKNKLADGEIRIKHKQAASEGTQVENPQQELLDMSGSTPSPTDFEVPENVS